MWRERVLIIDPESWRTCPGCCRGVRKWLWAWEDSCKAQLWLWGKWSPRGDFSAQPHPHPSCLWEAADHSVPYSLFVWLCLPVLSSVFLLASSSFSFTLVFFSPAGFWCQGIYRFFTVWLTYHLYTFTNHLAIFTCHLHTFTCHIHTFICHLCTFTCHLYTFTNHLGTFTCHFMYLNVPFMYFNIPFMYHHNTIYIPS